LQAEVSFKWAVVAILVQETVTVLNAERRDNQVGRPLGRYSFPTQATIVLGCTDGDVVAEHLSYRKSQQFLLNVSSHLFGGRSLHNLQHDQIAYDQVYRLDIEQPQDRWRSYGVKQ